VLEVAVAERAHDAKDAVVDEQLIARGDVYLAAVKGDAAQAAIPAAAGEVDLTGVPVHDLLRITIREVDEIDAPMALALLRAAHDGGGDELGREHAGRIASDSRVIVLRGAPSIVPVDTPRDSVSLRPTARTEPS